MMHKSSPNDSLSVSTAPYDHGRLMLVTDAQTPKSWLRQFLAVLDSSCYAYSVCELTQQLPATSVCDAVGLVLVALGDPDKSLSLLQTVVPGAQSARCPARLRVDPHGMDATAWAAGCVDDELLTPLDARLCHMQIKLWMQLSAQRRYGYDAARLETLAQTRRVEVLDSLFAHAPSALILMSAADGTVIYQNAQVELVLGQRLERDGRDWHGAQSFLRHPRQINGQSAPSYFSRAVAGASFFNDVDDYERADGSVIDVHLHASPVEDQHGRIVEVMFVFGEFTQQRRRARQQAQLARQLQVLADTSGSHVIILDPDERYLFANSMHKAFVETTSKNLAGKRLLDVVGDKVYRRLRPDMQKAFEGHSSASEIQLVSAEGAAGQFSVRWEPLRNLNYADGRCEGAILYFRDLARLRAAQSDADLSAQRFKIICEELHVIVYTIDSHHGVHYLNRAWTQFTGRSTNESLGRGWVAAIHPEDVVKLTSAAQDNREQQGVVEYEFRLQNRTGHYEWHLARSLLVTPVLNPQTPHRVGMLVNVHERKISREQVEQRLRENLLAGVQAQQRWAQERVKVDALQREREAREDFVAALSHDLRTPLTVVRLGVQRLEHKLAGNERLLPIVARMQRSVVRIDNMIRDFLDVSRVSAGRTLRLEREPCCLIDVVRNAIDELTPLYRGHLQLGGTERAYGMWDYDSMRRLIDNLVGNAIKYGDGARPITVGLRHEGNNAVLVVHNFGNVIPAEKRTDLFDRFTRLDGALERGAQGWGIGLRLVAAIAAAYDGSVQLRSEPDEGTTFSVILPILRPSTQWGDYGAIDAAAEPASDAIAKKRPSRPS